MVHVRDLSTLNDKLFAGSPLIRRCAPPSPVKREKAIATPIGGSSSGRTTDSDSVNLGSNPSPPASEILLPAEASKALSSTPFSKAD